MSAVNMYVLLWLLMMICHVIFVVDNSHRYQ